MACAAPVVVSAVTAWVTFAAPAPVRACTDEILTPETDNVPVMVESPPLGAIVKSPPDETVNAVLLDASYDNLSCSAVDLDSIFAAGDDTPKPTVPFDFAISVADEFMVISDTPTRPVIATLSDELSDNITRLVPVESACRID